MKLTPEQFILASFLGALGLLIFISWASYHSTTAMLENLRWVAHTREVQDELNETLSALTDAESGQRGYLLTGKETYLGPYYNASSLITNKINRLRELTKDNSVQQQRISEIERLTLARRDRLKLLIDQRRQEGSNFSVPIDHFDIGKQLMDDLRARISEMENDESRLLNERQALATSASRRTLLIISLGSFVALIITTVALFVMRREFVKRLRAEAKAQAFTHELERSNRELQDFAYVASHDLQEPLRKIQAFGDLLRKSHASGLDEEGRDFIERMQGAAHRMQILISELLAFSRVTTKGQPFTSVDLNVIAREVLGDLEVRLQQTGGRVELNELPVIEADPTQMRQLLQNLIGNALKFHRTDVPPVITISAEEVTNPENIIKSSSENFCQIIVADNGIGFDEKYLDRIFTPFQRLHGRNEYEGTGMGLAVCRRIVERHGGVITARSTFGQGSVFVVTLPLTQTDANVKDEAQVVAPLVGVARATPNRVKVEL